MSEKLIAQCQARFGRRRKPFDETPLISLGTSQGANSLLSRAGEAYDARDRRRNRKSRLDDLFASWELARDRVQIGNPGSRPVGLFAPDCQFLTGPPHSDSEQHREAWRCAPIGSAREPVLGVFR